MDGRSLLELAQNTAKKGGGRRGKPVILLVRAADMVTAGHSFFCSETGVWPVDHVPARFIDPGDLTG